MDSIARASRAAGRRFTGEIHGGHAMPTPLQHRAVLPGYGRSCSERESLRRFTAQSVRPLKGGAQDQSCIVGRARADQTRRAVCLYIWCHVPGSTVKLHLTTRKELYTTAVSNCSCPLCSLCPIGNSRRMCVEGRSPGESPWGRSHRCSRVLWQVVRVELFPKGNSGPPKMAGPGDAVPIYKSTVLS